MINKLAFALLLALSIVPAAQKVPKPAPDIAVDPEEYAAYAAAIKGLFQDYAERKIYIQSGTISFQCGRNSCNAYKVKGPDFNGCSGMRDQHQTPEQVLKYLRDSFTGLQPSTTADFAKKNARCSQLENLFPLRRDYLWTSGDTLMIGRRTVKDTPEEWRDPDLVFVSRVGLNAEKTQ